MNTRLKSRREENRPSTLIPQSKSRVQLALDRDFVKRKLDAIAIEHPIHEQPKNNSIMPKVSSYFNFTNFKWILTK